MQSTATWTERLAECVVLVSFKIEKYDDGQLLLISVQPRWYRISSLLHSSSSFDFYGRCSGQLFWWFWNRISRSETFFSLLLLLIPLCFLISSWKFSIRSIFAFSSFNIILKFWKLIKIYPFVCGVCLSSQQQQEDRPPTPSFSGMWTGRQTVAKNRLLILRWGGGPLL